MKFNLVLALTALIICVSAGYSQTELTIKKKTSMKVPGMPDLSAMPGGMSDPMKARTSTTYIKGARMRTDLRYEQMKRLGGKETVTQTTIVQCDKRRSVTYNSKKKKFFQESISPTETAASTKNAKKGGYITITGSAIDTGERAKLFGFDARHLKETYVVTPSKNACQKEAMTIEIEGWYADVPEFSCPTQRKPSEFRMGDECFDDVDFQVKGNGISGIPLKEIKKLSMNGMTMIIEEETISLTKTPISDSMFDPPAGYRAANTLREVEDDSPDDGAAIETPPAESAPVSTGNPAPTFALPTAGIDRGPKKPGTIRIGIAKPKVTTPDSKKDPESGSDIAVATANSLVEYLKAENVDAVILETDFPTNEGVEKGCDYLFFAEVSQKRGGGGMFGKMIVMGAVEAASVFVPGIGGMVASTVASQIMSRTMMKSAKAKDEFTLGYKVTGIDKAVLTQAVMKNKAEKDGDDVLTPQIQQVSKTVLAEIAKKK